MIVIVYLIAIVAANLIIAAFGPTYSIPVVFFLIGLDITARDVLHEQWQGKNLWAKIGLLILGGSALSALVNWQALPIAIASCVAFGCAGLADTLIYQMLHDRAFLLKVNGSNIVASSIDTAVFVVLAFGFPVLWGVMGGAILAKIAGGAMWSLVVGGLRRDRLTA